MLEKGLSAQSRTTVTNENTAAAMGSGDLPVFATPSMVALMENAAMTAAAAALPAGDDRGRGDERHPYQAFGAGR